MKMIVRKMSGEHGNQLNIIHEGFYFDVVKFFGFVRKFGVIEMVQSKIVSAA